MSKLVDKNGNLIMTLTENPSIEFTTDNAKMNLDLFNQLCKPSANETSNALRNISNVLSKLNIELTNSNNTFKTTADIMQDFADRCVDIGCTSFKIQPDDLYRVKEGNNIVVKKGSDLLRPETQDITENPNQNKPFDFLEQNAFDQDLLDF